MKQFDTKIFMDQFLNSICDINDPRIDRCKLHSLENILFIALCSSICDCNSFEDFNLWGVANQEWLETILDLQNGIPSADTFARLLNRLEPLEFNNLLKKFVSKKVKETVQQVIAIDGKTTCNSCSTDIDGNIHRSIHTINAYACESQLLIGQLVIDQKKNELSAVPELLLQLNIENQIVTGDAMYTNIRFVDELCHYKAFYILPVKKNNPTLLQQIKSEFDGKQNLPSFTTTEKGHGRIEIRKTRCINNLENIENAAQWKEIKTVIEIERTRIIKDQEEITVMYYISNLEVEPKDFSKYIRQHWFVENKAHWILDVIYREDYACITNNFAAQNMSTLRKLSLNILKKHNRDTKSIRGKRKVAGWNKNYLIELLYEFL